VAKLYNRLASGAVSEPVLTQWWAAWELLHAVRELFSKRFAELEALRDNLRDEFQRGHVSDPASYTPNTLPNPFKEFIHAWANRNGMSCDAVEKMAALIVLGDTASPRVTSELGDGNGNPLFSVWDAKGNRRDFLLIRADPFSETLDEFIDRAKAHYKEMCALFQAMGYQKAPSKRERCHFRYLAAHRVGGFSFAQISAGETGLDLPRRSASAVAEGANEAARLVGLPLRSKPGPRPGSRLPATHRVQRRKR
jgi:hypothetical protein